MDKGRGTKMQTKRNSVTLCVLTLTERKEIYLENGRGKKIKKKKKEKEKDKEKK